MEFPKQYQMLEHSDGTFSVASFEKMMLRGASCRGSFDVVASGMSYEAAKSYLDSLNADN